MHDNASASAGWSFVVRALNRHKFKAFLVFAIAVSAAVVGTKYTKKVYRSEAMLLVRLGRENAVLDSTAMAGGDRVVAIPMSREDEFNSDVEVLKSRALAERVVDKIGCDVILERNTAGAAAPGQDGSNVEGSAPVKVDSLTTSGWYESVNSAIHSASVVGKKFSGWLNSTDELTTRDAAVLACMKSLNVESARRSNIVQVSYDAHSPELAKQVAACFVEFFVEDHSRLYRSVGSCEFFADQAAKTRANLELSEQKLRDFKNESGLASPTEQRGLLVGRISAMEAEISRIEATRAASSAKVAVLRQKLSTLPKTQVATEDSGFSNEGTDNMRAELYKLRVEEEEAAAKMTDDSPRMRELRARNAKAREMLAAEDTTRKHVSTVPAKLYQEAELALLNEEPVLSACEAQVAELRTQVAGEQRALAQLNDNERRINGMQREIALNEASYHKYAVSVEQSRIDKALEDQRISNVSVVQTASFDRKPISPHVATNIMLGLLAGVSGGLALALGLEFFSRSLRSAEDVEKHLSLPTLAAIPRFSQKQSLVAVRP
jgi:uncharacterized protein involved in exopolysaccharide biosynthesis